MRGRDIKVTSERLARFCDAYVSDRELASRMLQLLWLDIYVCDQEFGVSPHDILRSIADLEAGEPLQGVKPATPFTRSPLDGLWHKHFFSARFLPENMRLGAGGKKGIGKLVDEVMDPARSSIITQEMIDELVHRLTHKSIQNRHDAGKLTGEWIVFTKHEVKNYYLCTNAHDAGDQFVYDRIMEYCVKDFPNLRKWIEAERARLAAGA